MIRHTIEVENYDWTVIVYYNVDIEDLGEIVEVLSHLNCSNKYLHEVKRFMNNDYNNTGFTYTNNKSRYIVTVINNGDDNDEFINTIAHEAGHIVYKINRIDKINDEEEICSLLGDIVMQFLEPFIINIKLDKITSKDRKRDNELTKVKKNSKTWRKQKFGVYLQSNGDGKSERSKRKKRK